MSGIFEHGAITVSPKLIAILRATKDLTQAGEFSAKTPVKKNIISKAGKLSQDTRAPTAVAAFDMARFAELIVPYKPSPTSEDHFRLSAQGEAALQNPPTKILMPNRASETPAQLVYTTPSNP